MPVSDTGAAGRRASGPARPAWVSARGTDARPSGEARPGDITRVVPREAPVREGGGEEPRLVFAADAVSEDLGKTIAEARGKRR